MTIEVIAIGSELLSGFSINTNAAFIGKTLKLAGFRVSRQTVIPDDPNEIQNAFEKALKRSSVVIVTGGLGPTLDDITKTVAADFFESACIYDEKIAEDLKKRFGNITTLESQASIPENAIPILNTVGTAPGLIFDKNGSKLILLPGVPKEMESMMDEVVAVLEDHFKEKIQYHQQIIHLYHIYESEVDPTLEILKKKYEGIEFGIYPGYGKLSVVAGSYDLELLENCLIPLKEKFKSHLLEFETGLIEGALLEKFIAKKLVLSVAESCTGGKISAKLTSVSRASEYFLGSIVCYSNFLKTRLLSIPNELLETKGAVSKECVEKMALNLLEMTGSDYSLSVSGIAGPLGGSIDKPIGTVFGAIAKKGSSVTSFELHLLGTRNQIIETTVNILLFELYTEVNKL